VVSSRRSFDTHVVLLFRLLTVKRSGIKAKLMP
jgi:hypothetical protein